MHSPSEEISVVAVRHTLVTLHTSFSEAGVGASCVAEGNLGGNVTTSCGSAGWEHSPRARGLLSAGLAHRRAEAALTQTCHLILSSPDRNREENLAGYSGANHLQVCPTNLAVTTQGLAQVFFLRG